ncbi:type ISP restriction/modification enzyme [Borrelia miyamotoi]|uniref:type ISP restriction/modification enzyme n=1 Tax=Borrelia miyamotoi TaxID=47466 RepID=UPI0022B2434F|nr:type ISP restriction/modification enzyme [Borrelia miyamotoi]WAZ96982.1 hypothetical protein O5405_06735 [Borrelia miyamotoi]WAZ98294.1 hypothetical protein O5401_06685 [Borrelia miyamotoi]
MNAKYVKKITYRPFDYRFIYYTKNKGVTSYPRYDIMRHFLEIKDQCRTCYNKTFSNGYIEQICSNISNAVYSLLYL